LNFTLHFNFKVAVPTIVSTFEHVMSVLVLLFTKWRGDDGMHYEEDNGDEGE